LAGQGRCRQLPRRADYMEAQTCRANSQSAGSLYDCAFPLEEAARSSAMPRTLTDPPPDLDRTMRVHKRQQAFSSEADGGVHSGRRSCVEPDLRS
jgi:hypothetical protein